MSDKIYYKGKVYGNTLATNSAVILTEPTFTENDIQFYVVEQEGETQEVRIQGGGRASYGNLNGNTIVVQGLKMTLTDDMESAWSAGLINPTDLYTSFDIDIGLLEVPNEEYHIVPLRHYELTPYSRTLSETRFLIKNTETDETIVPSSFDSVQHSHNLTVVRVLAGLSNKYIKGYNSASIALSDLSEDKRTVLLEISNNSSPTTTTWMASSKEMLEQTLYMNKSSDMVFNSQPIQYIGIYFNVIDIVPEGALYTYSEYEGGLNKVTGWNNTHYENGYVIANAYLVGLGNIPKSKIGDSPDLQEGQIGYMQDDVLYIKHDTSTIPYNNTMYLDKGDSYLINTLSLVSGEWNTLSLSHQNNNRTTTAYFMIPFASKAERDFALGMTQNLKYLTKEEYEAL